MNCPQNLLVPTKLVDIPAYHLSQLSHTYMQWFYHSQYSEGSIYLTLHGKSIADGGGHPRNTLCSYKRDELGFILHG